MSELTKPPVWRPAAIVFDCDGLLVNTEPTWSIAQTELFRRRGRDFGEAEKALLIGSSVETGSRILEREFAEPGRSEEIRDEYVSLVREAFTTGAPAMPGAGAMVRQALAAGIPIAVASNSPREIVDLALAGAGLDGLFHASIAADEIENPKPAPDLYLEACRRLGADPLDTLAFEDSAKGLQSAVAAGLRTVGIPSLASQPLDADWVWPSLAHDDLVAWAHTWDDEQSESGSRSSWSPRIVRSVPSLDHTGRIQGFSPTAVPI
jgi:HAD superfamily hydrolase (TIGR01509 family)